MHSHLKFDIRQVQTKNAATKMLDSIFFYTLNTCMKIMFFQHTYFVIQLQFRVQTPSVIP